MGGVGQIRRVARRLKVRLWRQSTERWGAAFTAILTIVSLFAVSQAACFSVYRWGVASFKSEVRRNMLRRVEVIATLIDPTTHQTFVSPRQEATEAYRRAIEPLHRVVAANDDICFVYTCVLQNGKVYFVLDPTPSGDQDHDGVDDKSHIMQPYDTPSPAMMRAFASGEPVVDSDPYQDEWGTFVSAFAPLRDGRGRQIGIVGLDLSAKEYLARLNLASVAYQKGILLCALLSLTFGAVTYRLRVRHLRSASRLDAAAVVEGQRAILERLLETNEVRDALQTVCQRADAIAGSHGTVIHLRDGSETAFQRLGSTSLPITEIERILDLHQSLPEDGEVLGERDEGGYWLKRLRMPTPEGRGWMAHFYSRGTPSKQECQALSGIAHAASLVIAQGHDRAEIVQARDQALAGLAAKQTFLTKMSHELRTPLNGVIGMATLLQMSDLEEDQLADVTVILNSAEHLLKMVDDLLEFSRIDSGSRTRADEPIELAELLEEVCAEFRPAAESKGLSLLLQVPPTGQARLVTDRLALRRSVAHLLDNAVRFTETGGVQVGAEFTPERVVVRVSDTGIGFGDDQRTAIFEAFRQADDSDARQFGGAGIGLSLVHRLIAHLDGQIHVESTPGRGSEFRISLPLTPLLRRAA